MKTAWAILLVTAFTDFIINSGTALTAVMLATEQAQLPNWPAIIAALIGGLVAAARTIQQALKAAADTPKLLTETPARKVV